MVVSYTKRTNPCVGREIRRPRTLDTGAVAYDRKWREQSEAFVRMYPFCILCLCRGKLNDCIPLDQRKRALVVDHIIPHQGSNDLFRNQDNWQTLGKGCHDRDKQSCDRVGNDWFALLRTTIKEKNTKAFIEQHRQWIPSRVLRGIDVSD